MRQDIIDKLGEVIWNPDYDSGFEGGFCENDYEHDIRSLRDYEGPFIWVVWRAGTYLVKTNDEEDVSSLLNNEQYRYLWAQGCGGLSYIPEIKDAKYIYYPGGDIFIKEVDYGWCVNYLSTKTNTVESNFKLRGGKFPKDLKIKMHFGYNMLGYVKEQLKYAAEHNDTSLIDSLHRLRKRTKLAPDHYIIVCKDMYERSFYFKERRDTVTFLEGGIIFHGYEDEGYQKNGSVQLEPNYGWSIHT